MLYAGVLSPATKKLIKPQLYWIYRQETRKWNFKKSVLKASFKDVFEMSVVDILIRRLLGVSVQTFV